MGKGFDDKVNEFLSLHGESDIVDIQYNSVYVPEYGIEQTVMVAYKA